MEVKTEQIIKTAVKETAMATVHTGLGFGVGCLVGYIVKGPVLAAGGIYAIGALAGYALDKLGKFLASKYNWNLSTFEFTKALSGAALSTALAVSLFALGIFGPVGLGVAVGLGLAVSAIPLGMGLYAKFAKKDMPYNEAVKFANQKPEEEASKEEKLELAKKQLFYKFAVAV